MDDLQRRLMGYDLRVSSVLLSIVGTVSRAANIEIGAALPHQENLSVHLTVDVMRCLPSVAGEFTVTTNRLCESSWLQRVVDCLTDFKQANTLNALGALRDRLSALVAAEDAPYAYRFAADGEQFRRHPIAAVESQDCSALLMYWPAGHATLPHDHAGLWGIEVVIDGHLDVDEYTQTGEAHKPILNFVRSLRLAAGDAAMFTSEKYVHRCRNRSNTNATLTLHVYGGVLAAYTAFETDDAGRIIPALRTTVNSRLVY